MLLNESGSTAECPGSVPWKRAADNENRMGFYEGVLMFSVGCQSKGLLLPTWLPHAAGVCGGTRTNQIQISLTHQMTNTESVYMVNVWLRRGPMWRLFSGNRGAEDAWDPRAARDAIIGLKLGFRAFCPWTLCFSVALHNVVGWPAAWRRKQKKSKPVVLETTRIMCKVKVNGSCNKRNSLLEPLVFWSPGVNIYRELIRRRVRTFAPVQLKLHPPQTASLLH